ncbi:MAG: T9SS type A sorting domain-containing protein [Endomicrobia bacterium]|nr:T9SS type A sorting domain-containing protein [Endomicrobiia bacterium]MCL2798824.1 T9SS type A sorting domain-containing protein [Endomicrobiia bacterium]
MNKKILFTSLILFFAFCGFSSAAEVGLNSPAVFRAEIHFSNEIPPLNVLHDQQTYVLQFSSFTADGRVVADSRITIDSVELQYSSDTVNFVTYSTSFYNALDKTFSFFVDNIDMSPSLGFYRFAVEYSTPGANGLIYSSNWFDVKNPKISHVHIERVSPIQKAIVLKGDVSDSFVSKVDIEYKIDENLNVSSAGLAGLKFTSDIKYVEDNPDFVEYRIRAYVDGSADKVKYYPYDMSYINAPVSSFTAKNITPDGDTIILDNEDQRYGNSRITFYAGALTSDVLVSITELDHKDPANFPSHIQNAVKLYVIEPEGLELNSLSPEQLVKKISPKSINGLANLILYQGNEKNGRFQIKHHNGSEWIDMETTQDLASKTVSTSISRLGYYAIAQLSSNPDNDYRPLERAFRPGETIEFRSLQAGDSVTIYNLRGQQITRLTASSSGNLAWDGKKNGSYVESGSYIYQIKTNGKVISGSLAFFR